jgi:motility quorum-sensing regulator/GCU-specific mRNA interferase toxin
MKESKKPTYDLETIKLTFNTIEKLNMTFSAMQGQYELGFSDHEVVAAIQALTDTDFYKSMRPQNKGFSAWHDVYKSAFKNIALYIKFQTDNRGEIILSFKAR